MCDTHTYTYIPDIEKNIRTRFYNSVSNRIGIVNSLLRRFVTTLSSIVQSDEVAFSISQSFGSVSRWTCWSILLRALQGWNHDASQHDTFLFWGPKKSSVSCFRLLSEFCFRLRFVCWVTVRGYCLLLETILGWCSCETFSCLIQWRFSMSSCFLVWLFSNWVRKTPLNGTCD